MALNNTNKETGLCKNSRLRVDKDLNNKRETTKRIKHEQKSFIQVFEECAADIEESKTKICN
ncbi:protein cornichon-like protein 4-like isoform X1 [Gossypium australe]|uniref:Protein cornichon-like protein 4-like isoform X1 n=1 Tax=Gossypium australe TaxID=47621 RepID=A0A5B6UIB6_9ROSI|nr:protein cornichon-like protein 4-like isoform X1 [Gossypium australe]